MANFIAAVLNAVLIQILANFGIAVNINIHPEDQYISVGGAARFMCGYNDTLRFPYWFINGKLYTIQGLPSRHSFRSQILTVCDVQAADNLTTYQCGFSEIRSQQATLFVWPDDFSETTTWIVTAPLTKTVNNAKTTDVSIITTTAATIFSVNTFTRRIMIGSTTSRQDNSVVIAAVTGSGSVIITFFIIASCVLATMIAIKYKKRKNLGTDSSDERPYEEVKDFLRTSPNVTSLVELKDNPSYAYTTRTEDGFYNLQQDRGAEDYPVYAEIGEKVNFTPNEAYHTVLHHQLQLNQGNSGLSVNCEVAIQKYLNQSAQINQVSTASPSLNTHLIAPKRNNISSPSIEQDSKRNSTVAE